ncbi:MAG TPA: DUF1456 family protein [Rectinemataceae bacterium]|nr:DUF1456 family protein [Rectinemataceae bacterium]
MNRNDVLRRLRYALNITDLKVLEILVLAGREMSREELEPFFLKEEEPGYRECPDEVLASFLDGLIISRRGPREEAKPAASVTRAARPVAAQPVAASQRVASGTARASEPPHLSNNEILKRLRIALELKDEDIIAIMDLVKVKVSKSELSAFFRKYGHVNWRPCGDQFLRNFLAGLTARYRV